MTDEANIRELDIVGEVARLFGPKVLARLLEDKATKRNIVWATDQHAELGSGYAASDVIRAEEVSGTRAGTVLPRVAKPLEEQAARTRSKAEVFTPTWLVCQMNDAMDSESWFDRDNVFAKIDGRAWETVDGKVEFPNEKGKGWKDYVDSRRLEITCGEAPFIVSRYDATTGETIPVPDRVGFLDRKLRVVTENAGEGFKKWAMRALEATYGYEYQGDSLLLGRCNVLMGWAEWMREVTGEWPTPAEALKAANVVAWNLWQMDMFTGRPPTDKLGAVPGEQMSLDYLITGDGIEELPPIVPECVIYDWRARTQQTYTSLKAPRHAARA